MKNITKVLNYFNTLYPEPKCALNFSSNYELLVAVILSAQCTDKRVNIVTKELFKIANTPEKMLILGENKLKEIIYPCGFYNNKSKSILNASKDIVEKFNGVVPSSLKELITLSGVGRKTANVVISVAFNKQAIAVDTHVHRIAKRLNLTTKNSTPLACEMALMKLVPKNSWSKFHHQTIWFGRDVCKAQNPKCGECKLKDMCNYYKNLK